MNIHIAVLEGGLSNEREVSLATGKAVAAALTELNYKVTQIDVGHNIADILAKLKPDIVFNALHGTYGEDGCIQGILEFLQIPYTHSGVMASAVAMHKPTAKRLFESVGIACASGKVVSVEELAAGDVMERPYVIKPLDEGSSVGVIIVTRESKLVIQGSGKRLVEKFIPGRELSVAVLDGKAIGVVEISPKAGFYDYHNKYTAGMTEYLIPAPIPKAIHDKAQQISQKAYDVLGCRGVARTDIRYSSDDNELYMLEINTHPGMTATSLVPKIAKHAGISFPNLADKLVKSARCDKEN